MKSTIKYLFMGVVTTLMTACGSDPAKQTEEEIFLGQLSDTWEVNSVLVDGETVTGAFDGLAITFTKNKTITVQNPVDPIWPAAGTFELVEMGDFFSIDRGDGVEITVTELSETALVMKFQYSAGSRAAGVSGVYTFEMK